MRLVWFVSAVAMVFSVSVFAQEYEDGEHFEEYGPVHDVFQEPKDDGGAAELHEQISDARGDFHNTVPEPSVKPSALVGVEHHRVRKNVASHTAKKKAHRLARHHAKKHTIAKHKAKKKNSKLAKHKRHAHRTVASNQVHRNSRVR